MSVLLSARAGGVLTLTLNRPEKRNALDAGLADALLAALADAARDDAVRCVVLAGAPPTFCAGGDVDAMRARHDAPEGAAQATKAVQEGRFGALARALLSLPKPVVANVSGDAFGAGLSLVLASDFAVASEGARFSASFARMALIPDAGASFLLPRLVGLRAARELALLAEPIGAARALSLGIVSEVVVAAGLDARVEVVAGRLAEGPTRALGLVKEALFAGASGTLEDALAREANLQALAFGLGDHREAVDAFVARRRPDFRGR
ncbi:MAG: enoyl-CoA hydratase/isomerase family protein [Thermoplasmatota archaeon]